MLFVSIYAYNIFFVGSIYYDSIFAENVIVTDNNVTFDVLNGNSALAFKKYDYEIKENNLYIKVRLVLGSRFYDYGDFKVNINDKFSDLENIYFTNGVSEKIVWSKDNKYKIQK